jgi:activating signal cointegrator complex subunit 1
MSLPTKDRLDEAIEFFQSLDLISMAREAEKAARVRGKKEKHASLEQQSEVEGVVGFGEESSCHEKAREMNPTLSPFSISLESLYALPRARAATVLHAVPVDSTSRLYPFCEMLRDKFLEAGFLQGEHKKEKDLKQESGSHQHIKEQNHEKSTNFPLPSEIKATVDERGLLEGMPVDIAEKAARKSDKAIRTRRLSKASKQRVRPLLLHATVANTIYVRGRGRGGGGAQKGKNRRNNQYTFDARDLLAHYRDYYVGSDRTTPRSTLVTTARDGREEGQTDAEDLSGNENSDSAREKGASLNESPPDKKRRMTKGDMLSNDTPRYPFVWAKDFPLEEVCICEMGAKKLDPNGDEGGMNARLREKYMAVVERSLDFRLSSQHT